MAEKKNAPFSSRLDILTLGLDESTHRIYVLIDEYDNFTNSVLAENGEQFYNAPATARASSRASFLNP